MLITHSGTLGGYAVVSVTLVGVTQILRIISSVSEYLRNIDTGGPRCVKGVNAPPRRGPSGLGSVKTCRIA